MDDHLTNLLNVNNKGAKKPITYASLLPFPFVLDTFSPTYCIHSATTLILHMRSHLRDHLQKLRPSWPYNGTSIVFCFLCSSYSPWNQYFCLLLFSVPFLLLPVPSLCVLTLSVLGCLLSNYTHYILQHSFLPFCVWTSHCSVTQSAWILAARGIPEVWFLLKSICLSEPSSFVLLLHSQQLAENGRVRSI